MRKHSGGGKQQQQGLPRSLQPQYGVRDAHRAKRILARQATTARRRGDGACQQQRPCSESWGAAATECGGG